jgi:hypothetical protein
MAVKMLAAGKVRVGIFSVRARRMRSECVVALAHRVVSNKIELNLENESSFHTPEGVSNDQESYVNLVCIG